MLYFCIRLLEKTLLDSISAASLLAPKMGYRYFQKWSTMPSARGTSGPHYHQVDIFCCAAFANDLISSAATSIFWRNARRAGVPRCGIRSFNLGLWANFQTIACSLAPLPTTRTFKVTPYGKRIMCCLSLLKRLLFPRIGRDERDFFNSPPPG